MSKDDAQGRRELARALAELPPRKAGRHRKAGRFTELLRSKGEFLAGRTGRFPR